jgi:hypothetical protein
VLCFKEQRAFIIYGSTPFQIFNGKSALLIYWHHDFRLCLEQTPRIASKASGGHSLVLSHKNLLAENHEAFDSSAYQLEKSPFCEPAKAQPSSIAESAT